MAVLCGVAAGVWADVATSGVLAAADAPLLETARASRSPALTTAALAATHLGGGWGRLALTAVVAGSLAVRARRWWPVLAPAAALAAAPAANEALKRLVGRVRPPVADAVYATVGGALPSGHAMGAAALAVVLTWVVLRSRPRVPPAVVVAAAAAYAGAVGASRVYLGVHWPTDVLAGWALGSALGWAVVLVAAGSVGRADGLPRP